MAKLPTPVDAFDTIRAVAREHAMDPKAGTCVCKHVQTVHRDHWGACHGRHGGRQCDCQGFRGIYWHKARIFERYGVALIARLRDQTRQAGAKRQGNRKG
jgi:hypothetical protein